jgi:tRNA-2-methylthio-N6-dimethylallyladenosine synthase
MQSKGVHIITMGCQMNVYDSEQMERILAPMGYMLVLDPDQADLILVNTCSVREKAEHKVYSCLGRLSRAKQRRPELIIGVGGCVAQQEGDRIFRLAPHVDMVFGTFAYRRLPALIRQVTEAKGRVVDIDTTGALDPPHTRPSDFQDGRAAAFVTIMSGCDNYCSYCIVPYVRGREISRTPESILEEIQALAKSGIREVTLLGQNVNSYGMKNGHGLDFVGLLEAINDVEGLKRIRFTTSHPKDLSDELIGAFGSLEKLAPHIHLPVQCGADRILRRMNRGYTRDYYFSRIEKLREVRSDMAITSDIIVGFPGEEEIDFEQTLSLVRSVRFDNLYIFKYSERPNTSARRFSHKVEEAAKRERFARLLGLQTKITLEKHLSLVGTVQDVLVECPSKRGDGQMAGRTPCNKVVNFSGATARVGQVMGVSIVEAFSHCLRGSPEVCGSKDGNHKGGILHAA